MTFQSRKEELERQIRSVADWKKQFKTEVEQFKWQIFSYQEGVEKSWESLEKTLNTCAESGFKEVEANLRFPTPNYHNTLANWLMAPQANLELFKCATDFSSIFRPMKDLLESSKVVLQVNGPDILPDFEDANIVIGRNEEKYTGRRDLNGRKSGYGVGSISEGCVFEGVWEKDTPIHGKTTSSKGVFIGEYSKQRQIKGLWVAFAVIACFAAMLVFKDNGISQIQPSEGVECTGVWENRDLTGWGVCNDFSSFPWEESSLTIIGPIKQAEGQYFGQVNGRGQRYRYGVQNYTDGSSYSGHWRSDLRHGEGRFTAVNLDLLEGYWHEGRLEVGSRKDGHSNKTWLGW